MNNRRRLIIALGAGGLAAPVGLFAQQQGKVWRVGFLSSRHVDFLDTDNYYGPFRQGMRELGYPMEKILLLIGALPTENPSVSPHLLLS